VSAIQGCHDPGPPIFKFFHMQTILLNILYWIMAIAPGLPIPLIYLAYRKILANKRNALSSLMAQDGVFSCYQKRFGKAGETADQVVTQLFALYYGPVTYVLPIIMNVAVIALGIMIGMIHAKVPFALPFGVGDLVRVAPVTLSLGFAGAYIQSLYDTLRRCRESDLSAYSLHFTWVHMVLASILAPLVARAFAPEMGQFVAFGVGLFPLKDTFEYARNLAKKKLEISLETDEVKGLPMGLVEGLNKNVVDRLDEEGITSIVDLAYSDPIKLFLKTNYPWAWVIDVMDQALLINYVGAKIDALRPIGIRGSIEMSVLGEAVQTSDIVTLIAISAKRLDFTVEEARSLGQTMYADEQVDLIWQLFKPNEPEESPLPLQPPPAP
jgi:hypothetical protein